MSAFSKDDSLVLLAHNLDFWLPYIFEVIESRLSTFERIEIEDEKQFETLRHLRDNTPTEIDVCRPLKGGNIWHGQEEAQEATRELIKCADREGRLRKIIDAIRSNRIEDDFSEHWSFAREDFERKLYKKRSKTKVAFVELDDTIPVHCPESEVHENILWEDFIAILNPKEKQIVVCLRNGFTKIGDISKELGYANHSPVSKALIKIRNRANEYLK